MSNFLMSADFIYGNTVFIVLIVGFIASSQSCSMSCNWEQAIKDGEVCASNGCTYSNR
jgi:hypothetical protein